MSAWQPSHDLRPLPDGAAPLAARPTPSTYDRALRRGIREGIPLPPEDRSRAVPETERRSLDEIYRARASRLLRVFARRTGRDEAEDMLQESFARLATVENGSTEIACPDAYLSRIAGNLLRDRAKSAFQRSLAEHASLDEIVVASADPIAALEARDVLNRLNTAILRLSPTTREVFMAHRLDGLSHAEIAERTGMSTASVARRMTKAIAQVHRVMRSR